MKKIWMIVIAMAFLLGACAQSDPIEENGDSIGENGEEIENGVEDERNVGDYFPFLEDTLLVYEGAGNEYAEKDVYFDFIHENKAQLRERNPGTIVVKVVEVQEDQVVLTYSEEEMYHLEDVTEVSSNREEVLLKEPLEEGNAWTLADGRERSITGVDVAIETPSGNYEGIEVTTELENGTIIQQYYVEGIGEVKSVFRTEDGYDVVTSLEEIRSDVASEFSIQFFYPNFQEEKLVYLWETVEFRTNDAIHRIFEEHLREAPAEELRQVISENTEINSIHLNRENNIVTVDFTEELIREMNAGVFLESQILHSIVNTFGNHFRRNKVIITVEGESYESGHIYMEEGEYIEITQEAVAYEAQ